MKSRDIHEASPEVALIGELCKNAERELDHVITDTVHRIREELPEYRTIPRAEHLDAVAEQLRRRLLAVGQDRTPDPSDLHTARLLARARAAQHIPISTLVDAYHLGDSALWETLVLVADDRTKPVLPRLASRMLNTMHTLSAELASAHSEVAQSLQGHRITLVHRLIELLTNGSVDRETEAIARALALDPDQTWQAMVWTPANPEAGIPFALQHRLSRLGDTVVCAARRDALVALAGSAHHAALHSFATNHLNEGRLGLGLARPGLNGAAVSLEDARLALAAAVHVGDIRTFDKSWVEACVLAQIDRLRPILQTAIDVAGAHPHLARAVEAYWEGSLSLATASEAMNLHPNSLSYRLARWAALTGLDPRAVSQAFSSWIAVLEARRLPRPG